MNTFLPYFTVDPRNPLILYRAILHETRQYVPGFAAVPFLPMLSFSVLLAPTVLPDLRLNLGPWLLHFMAFFFLLSYLLPPWIVKTRLRQMRRSGKLEPVLLTPLSNGEIVRGIIVPDFSKALPGIIAAGLFGLVLPFLTPGHDWVRHFLLVAVFLNIALNHVSLPWITLGLLADSGKLRIPPPLYLAMVGLDPFVLIFLSGIIHLSPAWNPLLFAFGTLQIIYAYIKCQWAWLTITDLNGTFRHRLAS